MVYIFTLLIYLNSTTSSILSRGKSGQGTCELGCATHYVIFGREAYAKASAISNL